jgi:chromosome partitioning protein
MRTIAVINQKGGCGKTTTAINVSAGLARRGFRTLLIDLDPQSHCAAGLGVPEDRLDLDVGDALRLPTDAPIDRERFLWRVGRGLDLLPSRMRLAGLESARGGLADMDQPQNRLASVIERLVAAQPMDDRPTGAQGIAEPKYDVVVIDCPPSIGLLSYNALAAASEIVIPVETSYFSLRGAGKQIQTARSVTRHIGVEPRVRLLATMYDPSLPLARDLLDDLRDRFGSAVIPTVIRLDPEVKEAASFGRPVEEHAPESMGADDYGSLCEWLIEHAALDRPEPGDDAGCIVEPRLPEATLVTPGSGPALSRAQEMALKAASMTRSVPLRRSLMPHKPVAIEIVPDPEPANPAPPQDPETLRHLWGVRAVAGGLLFVQPVTVGGSVSVVGGFNGWSPERGKMTKRTDLGIFECRVECPSGRHEYRLVVDGQWCCDPHNPARTPNGLGGENNVASA